MKRDRVEREMDEELRFHVDAYAADLVRRGVPPDEAQRRARAEFGGVEAKKEECRDALGLRLFDELSADVRYAWRQLKRSPAFSLVAILSLALGIGANSALFSLMEAALWKPIAVHEPERLALFSWTSGPRAVMNSSWGNWARTTAGAREGTSFSYPLLERLRHQPDLFETVFAFKPIGRVTAIVGGEVELVQAQLVSGEFFRGVGVTPVIGRGIEPDDDVRGGSETVAVISDGYWARRFGRNPAAVGSQIRVNQVPVTVIGVNPRGFAGIEPGERPDVFLPLLKQPLVYPWRRAVNGSLLDNADYWWALAMGRLKPGVTHVQAQSALDVALQQGVKATLPGREDRDQPRFRLLEGWRGQNNLREQFGRPLVVLAALVVIVLLVACANVANLLLARGAARRRELSLRLALGAGRWRISRQLLTEGLALSTIGGALGILLGYWTRDAIPQLLLPSWAAGSTALNADFDLRVLLLTAAVTVATTVLASLAPIWQSLRVEINTALKDGGRTALTSQAALRAQWFVVFQVCLSVLLLVGAGLFARTLMNLRSIEIGFRPERVLLFTMDPPRARYAGAERKTLFEKLDEAIGAIPGVEAASLSESVLLSGGSSGTSVGPNGRTPGPKDQASVNDVGRRFFETMGIPILAGRSFNERDRASSPPVAIVNQRFVKEFFPNENPIGRTLRNNGLLFEIVGVSADTASNRLRGSTPPTFYRLFAQALNEPGSMTFEVRTGATTAVTLERVRAAVQQVDRELPIFDVRTQTEQIDALLGRDRLFVALTLTFGAVALILAAIGVYGLMAHAVARRTGEIGIRLALGAERRGVLVMMLRESASLAGLGIAVGVLGAILLSRYIASALYGVEPVDLVSIAAAVMTMMSVALVAGWIPARRAARLDPMIALRHE